MFVSLIYNFSLVTLGQFYPNSIYDWDKNVPHLVYVQQTKENAKKLKNMYSIIHNVKN